MATQIKDSGNEILLRVGNTTYEIPKEGLGTKTFDDSSGEGVWIQPEGRGQDRYRVDLADLSDPGNLTSARELQEYIHSLVENVPGGGGDTVRQELAPNATTKSTVTASASSKLLCAANANRKEVVIRNLGPDTLYVKKGTGAVIAEQPIKLLTDDVVVIDDYSGIIHGIWTGIMGGANVEESYYS